MTKDIRVRVGRGVLELLDPVEFPEGTEVTVTIHEISTPEDREAFRPGDGKAPWMQKS